MEGSLEDQEVVCEKVTPFHHICVCVCVSAEWLNAIIRRNEEAGILHGYTIPKRAPTISHLLFVDDAYFFFKATEAEANMMK